MKIDWEQISYNVKENTHMNWQCELQNQFQLNSYWLVLGEELTDSTICPKDTSFPSSTSGMVITIFLLVLQLSFWVHIQIPTFVHGQYIPFSLLFKAALGTFCNDFDIFVTSKSSDTVHFQLMSFVRVFHVLYRLC